MASRPGSGAAPSRLHVTGHYAGAVSRAVGAAIDGAIVVVSFTAGLAGVDLLTRVVAGESLVVDRFGPISIVVLAGWAFSYVYASLAIAGRTVGKGLIGLRVVGADGTPISARSALIRTLAFPLSVLPLGLGLTGVVLHREHRTWHDRIARTAVVYDWGDRPAELPGPLSDFVLRKAGPQYASRSAPEGAPRP